MPWCPNESWYLGKLDLGRIQVHPVYPPYPPDLQKREWGLLTSCKLLLPIWCSEISALLFPFQDSDGLEVCFHYRRSQWAHTLTFSRASQAPAHSLSRIMPHRVAGWLWNQPHGFTHPALAYSQPPTVRDSFPFWSALGGGQPPSFIFHGSHLRVISSRKLSSSSREKGLFSPSYSQYSLHILLSSLCCVFLFVFFIIVWVYICLLFFFLIEV